VSDAFLCALHLEIPYFVQSICLFLKPSFAENHVPGMGNIQVFQDYDRRFFTGFHKFFLYYFEGLNITLSEEVLLTRPGFFKASHNKRLPLLCTAQMT